MFTEVLKSLRLNFQILDQKKFDPIKKNANLCTSAHVQTNYSHFNVGLQPQFLQLGIL